MFLFSSFLEIRWGVRYVRYGSFITDQTHRRVRLGMVTNSHSWTFPPIALWKAPAPAQEHTHFQGGPLRCGPVTVETHGSPQPVTPTPKKTSDSALSRGVMTEISWSRRIGINIYEVMARHTNPHASGFLLYFLFPRILLVMCNVKALD